MCVCSSGAIERYRQRLSGPLRERFDLSLSVPAVSWAELTAGVRPESSHAVRVRVLAARTRQIERQGKVNGRLDGRDRERYCRPTDRETERLLGQAVQRFQWSARATARVLRVARTIADLAGMPDVSADHLTEALQFRAADSAAR